MQRLLALPELAVLVRLVLLPNHPKQLALAVFLNETIDITNFDWIELLIQSLNGRTLLEPLW